MTKQEIENKLNVIGENKIKTREKRIIEIDKFLDMFGDSDLNYKSLIENKSCTDGWKNIFKNWKEQGLIK